MCVTSQFSRRNLGVRLKAFLFDLNLDNGKVRGGGYGVCLDGEAPLTCRRLFLSGILLNSKQIGKARRRTRSCFCIHFIPKDLCLR